MKKLLAEMFTEEFKEQILKDISEKKKAKTGSDKSEKQVSACFEKHN